MRPIEVCIVLRNTMACPIVPSRLFDSRVVSEGLDVVVVSTGGSGANSLLNAMEAIGLTVRSQVHDAVLCHLGTYSRLSKPTVYVYNEDVQHSVASQARRQLTRANMRQMTNGALDSADQGTHSRLIQLSIESWTGALDPNLFCISYSQLFEAQPMTALSGFIGREIAPLRYVPPASKHARASDPPTGAGVSSRTVYIDIDNTICDTVNSEYATASPRSACIEQANELYRRGHTIVYWTARGGSSGRASHLFRMTLSALDGWGCRYHELRMGKPSYDLFIDDKTVSTLDEALRVLGDDCAKHV